MKRQEAVDFVVRELGKHHTRNDIIEKLCETSGLNWKDAEKFVQQVETENQGTIALRQSPLVTLIGLGTVLGGIGLMAWMAIATLSGINIYFLSFPVPYLGNLVYFGTGLAMFGGALWGLWDTISKIWNS